MPISWDPTMDRKLLLAILKHHNIALDTAAVAKELSTDEQPCTANAIQKRITRIRVMIKDGDGSTGGDEGTPKPKATPRKRGAKADASGESPTKKAKAKDGKGKQTNAEDEEDEETGGKVGVKQEGGNDFDDLSV